MTAPRQRRIASALPLGAALVVAACGEADLKLPDVSAPQAVFSPDDGEIPLPNDLLFLDTGDGTLNPDDPDDPDEQALVDALSALDGWSTVAPVRFAFSQPLDPTTVELGTSVRMFEVTLDTDKAFAGAPVKTALRELDGTEIEVALDDDALGLPIPPLLPLAPAPAYTALVTRDVIGVDGQAVIPNLFMSLALVGEKVEPSSELFDLQERMVAEMEALEPFGIEAENVATTTTFSTQSIDSVQKALVAIAKGEEEEFVAQLQIDSPFLDFSNPLTPPAPAAQVGIEGQIEIPLPEDVPFWLSDFYRGWLEVPYYLEAAEDVADLNEDDTPISSHFRTRFPFGFDDDERNTSRFNPLPAAISTERIPMFVTVPFGAVKPENGWPVMILQHGITGDRSNLLGLASTLGLAKIAGVAIDLPLHGIVDDESELFAGYDTGADGVRERHFGLDLLTEGENGESQDVSDGELDSSGAHFIQLANLRTTRDNVKQAVADLLQLRSVLDQIDIDGDGIGDFDSSQVYFVGHSLGAIVGAQFLPFAEDISAATLGMPGGGLVGLLVNSPAFEDRILDGLAEEGIYPGTDEYLSFLDVAQAVSDSADPVNHVAKLAEQGSPLHLIEVVGEVDPITGEQISPPDETVPPNVEGFPLSGTDPLIELLELPTITKSIVDFDGVRCAVRFKRGDHISLLIPTDFNDFDLLAAWQEMQTQTVDFAFNGGLALTVVAEGLLAEE
ncbi:MAG: hypothetical protein ACYSWX_01015 [Planctomycetota bacterium]|jgi:pimeloyl-ACP methyl ester carboxylesterase